MTVIGAEEEYSRYHYVRALYAAHWDGRHDADNSKYWRHVAGCPLCDPSKPAEPLVLPWKK